MPTTVYLGLGSNIGDRGEQLAGALDRLASCLVIQAVSNVYESAAVGFEAQPAFWNLVLRGETRHDPHDLLGCILKVEQGLGRERSFRNAPRTIDIDILLFGAEAVNTEQLTIPHPRMHERSFVQRPLAELGAATRPDAPLGDAVPVDTLRLPVSLRRWVEGSEYR